MRALVAKHRDAKGKKLDIDNCCQYCCDRKIIEESIELSERSWKEAGK